MRFDPRDGRGALRAGSPWRGLGRALFAALRIVAATGLRSPRCRRVGA
ncbi:MAG TPA: hypothetical protein VLC53_03265 [Myxococcota bacterium]|nr:hypothetical protein [Myxococcota bacterium]